MNGLYALKPWYARQLEPVADRLELLRIRPNQVSAAGVVFAATAAALLATVPACALTGLLVAVLLAARLACANVDGTLARRRPANPFGGVINELGDRAADLVMLAGFIPFLGWSTAVLMLAATLPSWAALAVAANGGPRSNSGPMGKTERCALAALAAATGWYSLVALVVAVGCAATAIVRLRAGHRSLSDGAGR